MNLRVGMLTGLLLLSGMAIFVPPASAQACQGGVNLVCSTTTDISIAPPTSPIKPLGAFIALPITIRYSYAPTTVSLAATPIQLTVTAFPPWAVATVSPSSVYIPVAVVEQSGGAAQTKTANSFLLVSATIDAPAFTQGTIEVTANALVNGNLQPSVGKVQIPVQADFFSIIEATTPSQIQKAKPQSQVPFPITVTNFGNALTKVEFLVDQIPDKWQVSPPSPITLQSRQQGQQGNIKTANLNIQTPFQNGYLNVVGAVTVRLKSSYALDPKVIGDSTLISTLTTTKGFYVPGFDPTFMVVAFGLVATAMARRSQKQR